MHLPSLIDQIANEADDFLDGVTSREQARAAISEVITLRAVHLDGTARRHVTDGVMSVLESEGFFDNLRAGNSGEGDDDGGPEE